MADQAAASRVPMSEQERLALCQKLDSELIDFINSLERKRYNEGWPEEKWEVELNKHPFFMKQAPESGELSPLAQGLAKLKFDPAENTPVGLALNYKEDGNFNFQHKNYRLALLGYTEGIKVRCGHAELQASLYNNRAAAHWYLKNYRSSLADCEKALTFNPKHTKAHLRAAKCAFEIGELDTCLDHCQALVSAAPRDRDRDKEVAKLVNEVKKKKLILERDARRKAMILSRKKHPRHPVVEAIIERGIKVSRCDDQDDIDLSHVDPCLPESRESVVSLDNGVLKWPVLILYPEFQTTDFMKKCPENASLANQMASLFPAPWDEKDQYRLNTVNLYFEGDDKMPHLVDMTITLGEVLKQKYFELRGEIISFIIVPRGSLVETTYLKSYNQ